MTAPDIDLDALEAAFVESQFKRVAAERDALAAELKVLLEQEPVAWVNPSYAEPAQGCTYSREDHERWPHIYSQPLYAHPVPARELTDETIQRHWDEACKDTPQTPGWSRHIRFARAIERHLKGVSENG